MKPNIWANTACLHSQIVVRATNQKDSWLPNPERQCALTKCLLYATFLKLCKNSTVKPVSVGNIHLSEFIFLPP